MQYHIDLTALVLSNISFCDAFPPWQARGSSCAGFCQSQGRRYLKVECWRKQVDIEEVNSVRMAPGTFTRHFGITVVSVWPASYIVSYHVNFFLVIVIRPRKRQLLRWPMPVARRKRSAQSQVWTRSSRTHQRRAMWARFVWLLSNSRRPHWKRHGKPRYALHASGRVYCVCVSHCILYPIFVLSNLGFLFASLFYC